MKIQPWQRAAQAKIYRVAGVGCKKPLDYASNSSEDENNNATLSEEAEISLNPGQQEVLHSVKNVGLALDSSNGDAGCSEGVQTKEAVLDPLAKDSKTKACESNGAKKPLDVEWLKSGLKTVTDPADDDFFTDPSSDEGESDDGSSDGERVVEIALDPPQREQNQQGDDSSEVDMDVVKRKLKSKPEFEKFMLKIVF